MWHSKNVNTSLKLLKWLGIDEIHIIRRPRLVLTNIERRTIYDIKPNRNKETVIQRLSEISDRTYIE